MTPATSDSVTERERGLRGQTVVVVGGSAGIGFETARAARADGADVVLTARDPERLRRAGRELGALSTAAFDAADPDRLGRLFAGLSTRVDHVMVTAGRPYYAPLAEIDFDRARRSFDGQLWLALRVARHAADTMRPGGSLLFMSGTGGRRRGVGLSLIAAATAALPALVANLAVEVAPVRVNLIAALAIHLMANTAVTGATYDIDGREQLV